MYKYSRLCARVISIPRSGFQVKPPVLHLAHCICTYYTVLILSPSIIYSVFEIYWQGYF